MTPAHFSRAEFQCPHCHVALVRPRLLQVLERLRAVDGNPLRIVSGYRCPVHNAAVGGASDSQHMYGAAADLELGRFTLGEALRAGAVGIGLQQGFVRHVDVRDGAHISWTYPG